MKKLTDWFRTSLLLVSYSLFINSSFFTFGRMFSFGPDEMKTSLAVVSVTAFVVFSWRIQSFKSILSFVKTVSDNHSANFLLPIFFRQSARLRKFFSFPALSFHVVNNDKHGSSEGNSCSTQGLSSYFFSIQIHFIIYIITWLGIHFFFKK